MELREPVDVLVVDDHPGQAGTTAEMLRTAGLSVLTASTIEQGLHLCRGILFGVVILDHGVVGPDSERFLDNVGDKWPVVMVSGLGPDVLDAFRRRHSDRVFAALRKPVTPFALIEVVLSALARSPTSPESSASSEAPESPVDPEERP